MEAKSDEIGRKTMEEITPILYIAGTWMIERPWDVARIHTYPSISQTLGSA
jgi:hypothetical protein